MSSSWLWSKWQVDTITIGQNLCKGVQTLLACSEFDDEKCKSPQTPRSDAKRTPLLSSYCRTAGIRVSNENRWGNRIRGVRALTGARHLDLASSFSWSIDSSCWYMAISRSSLISLNKEVGVRARWISNVFMSLTANVGSRSTCEAMLRYLTREKLT